MKEEQEKRPARLKWKGKRANFYAVIGVVSVVLSVAIVWTATALGKDTSAEVVAPNPEKPAPEKPVEVDDKMTMPILQVSLLNDHGFYYNQTLDYYGHHDGVDFEATVGEKVFCVKDGVVESIYTADKLLGTEITIDHGDGVKTLYRFVEGMDGLKVGASVKKGQQIASVAEPSGGEYKDGAHLHFEVLKEGVSVNPDGYLPLADK